MKDEEDKSNQPTMPPPPGHDVEELTVAGAAPPEILALLAEHKKKLETAPVLTSSTLEDDDGWGATEPAEPAPKALTDSMPTPQAFEIYNAPAASAAPTAKAASSLSTETPAIDFYPMDLPREVEAKIASRGIQSSSMPTPMVMPVQLPPPSVRAPAIAINAASDATPTVAPIESAAAEAKAATPAAPAALADDPKKESAPPKPVTSIPPPAKSTFDRKFVAAIFGVIVILAAIGAWALR